MHRVRFAVEFVGCAAIGALAGILFGHFDALFVGVTIVGFGLCAGFLAHLLLGLWGRWRFHYVMICRFFALVLVGILCFVGVASTTGKANKQAARDYLEQIKPHLEDYRQNNGHYPDALSEVPGLPAPPSGFYYRREKDPLPENPDTYRVDYYSLEYWSGNQQWFDDD
jgi:hypothetical protein